MQREKFLSSASSALLEARELLERAIAQAESALSVDAANQLRRAARRTIEALDAVHNSLSFGGTARKDFDGDDEAPPMDLGTAKRFVSDLDLVISTTENGVLKPAETELAGDDLRQLRKSIGQAWGWLVCDLQDPLWRLYPELAPKRDS